MALLLSFTSGCDSAEPVWEADAPQTGLTFSDLPDGLSLTGGFYNPGALEVSPDPAAEPVAALRIAPASDYGCVLATADPGPDRAYRYRSVWLHFDDVEPGTPVATFRSLKRTPTADGAARAAVCRIPQTREALEQLGALLGVDLTSSTPSAETVQPRRGAATARMAGPVGPNEDGYSCMEGMWWGDESMTWCTNGLWNSTPVITVEEDPLDDGSATDGPWDGSGDNPSEGEPSGCISDGPGMPCLPGGSGGDGGAGPAPLPLGDDEIPEDEDPPDCSEPQTEPWAIDYCAAREPNDAEQAKLTTAYNNIKARGSVCVRLAQVADSLMAAGDFRLYTPGPDTKGGWARRDLGIWIDEAWPSSWDSGSSAETDSLGNPLQRNLEQTIAHEADHYIGLDHSDSEAGGFRTLNSGTCSGLPNGRRST